MVIVIENARGCILCMPGSHTESETGSNLAQEALSIGVLRRQLLQEAELTGLPLVICRLCSVCELLQ